MHGCVYGNIERSTRVLPRNSLRDVERVLLYGPNIHIKAYCPSTLPHQRKISDEGMLDRHALQLLGRTLRSTYVNFNTPFLQNCSLASGRPGCIYEAITRASSIFRRSFYIFELYTKFRVAWYENVNFVNLSKWSVFS